jgi:hypothetical protein
MSVGWYIRRLANMSGAEILHRLGETGRKRSSRYRRYGWEAFPARGALKLPQDLSKQLNEGLTPALAGAIRDSAAKLLDGAFSAHGVAWPRRERDSLFTPQLWRLDPVSGGFWPGPDRYCFDISYRHERVFGDIKFVWDLNRLQFLQPLAAAAVIDANTEAAGAIDAAIASWMESNPPFRGICWNSGIELALRAVSVALAASLAAKSLKPETLQRAESLLRAHHYWLGRYPSLHSSANNHLVAEALGQFVIETLLPDLRQDDHARQTLEREALLQIFGDGVGAEQSPTYAAFTAEMLLVADLFARAAGQEPLVGPVAERLKAFTRWIAWMSDAQGRVPNIGDDDEGRVLTLCAAREAAYPNSIARAIRGLYPNAAPCPASPDGPELRDAFFHSPSGAAALDGVKTFAEGGYTIVREMRAGKKLFFMIDHGPLGYLSIAAHGHADANAFVLSLDDEEIFVDPGTYLYHSGAAWRDWFRGTRAHNTLAVADADQSSIAGPFNWSHKARARLETAEVGRDWRLCSAHDGYCERFGVEHQREAAAAPGGIVLIDRLSGARSDQPASVSFQLAPGLHCVARDAGWLVTNGRRELLTMRFSAPGEVRIVRAGALGEGGWHSPRFGDKIEADQIVWRGRLPPDGLTTTLDWSASPAGEDDAFAASRPT